jgi:hypothetical protein
MHDTTCSWYAPAHQDERVPELVGMAWIQKRVHIHGFGLLSVEQDELNYRAIDRVFHAA